MTAVLKEMLVGVLLLAVASSCEEVDVARLAIDGYGDASLEDGASANPGSSIMRRQYINSQGDPEGESPHGSATDAAAEPGASGSAEPSPDATAELDARGGVGDSTSLSDVSDAARDAIKNHWASASETNMMHEGAEEPDDLSEEPAAAISLLEHASESSSSNSASVTASATSLLGFKPGGRIIAFQGLDGDFLKLKPGRPTPTVVSEKPQDTPVLSAAWTCFKFTVVDKGNGDFAFHNPLFNRFLKMNDGGKLGVTGHASVTGSQTEVAAAERDTIYFKVVDGGGDYFGFWNKVQQKLISQHEGVVSASAHTESPKMPPNWSNESLRKVKYTVYDLGYWPVLNSEYPVGHIVSLYNDKFGRYLSMKGDQTAPFGGLSFAAPCCTWTFSNAHTWTFERFTVVNAGDGTVALHNPYWNRYLKIEEVAGNATQKDTAAKNLDLGTSEQRDPDSAFPQGEDAWEACMFKIYPASDGKIGLWNEKFSVWLGARCKPAAAGTSGCCEAPSAACPEAETNPRRPFGTFLRPGSSQDLRNDEAELHWEVVDMARTPLASSSL